MIKKITVEGKEYILTPTHLKSIEENKLDGAYLRMRVRSGWPLDLAVKVPHGVGRNEADAYLRFKELDARKKKNKKDYSKPKPWLEKYPQVTRFGDYAQQLFKDCFGSW